MGYLAARTGLDFETALEARSTRILNEILKLRAQPSWAGEYHLGDGLGRNVSIRLAPQSGFTYDLWGCLGTYDQNHGTVVQSGELLRLVPSTPMHPAFPRIPETLELLRVGNRRYLVPPEELEAFTAQLENDPDPNLLCERWLVSEDGEDASRSVERTLLLMEALSPAPPADSGGR